MPAKRTVRIGRSITFTSALLLTTALAAPAFAQIEEVVVTAQKRAEDVQTVPIAVSAFSGADLAAHQIEGFKDLQFAIPNVTFTHGNFGPSNFQIRGIGSAAVTTSGDSGVSVNLNQVYLSSPPLTSATYYDLDNSLGIQVLRGPQGTLWGRNATGGAIDVETAKPDLDNFGANIEATYGNFNDKEVRAMLNLPIEDGVLAVRLAGFWENRDGDIDNVYPSLHPGSNVRSKIDSRNDFSLRQSLRYQPTTHTTIDIMLQESKEDDTRIRGQDQLCHSDPSGILGCLPDKLAFEPENQNATLGLLLNSNIGPLAGTPFTLLDVSPFDGSTDVRGEGVGQFVPHNLHTVDTDFTPHSQGHDMFSMIHAKQEITPWLDFDLTVGYDRNNGAGDQSFTNAPGDDFSSFGATCTQLFLISGGLDATCTPIPGQSRLVAAQEVFAAVAPKSFGTYYAGRLGTLPLSQPFGNGVTGLAIHSFDDHFTSSDQIQGWSKEVSAEARFTSNFSGPLNFLFALYHLHDSNNAQYWVNANSLDYFGTIVGGATIGDGFILGPTNFDSDNHLYTLTSNAAFGELYYQITDDLKLTGGLRYTKDEKFFQSRNLLFNIPEAIGCDMECNTQSLSAFQVAVNNPQGTPYTNQQASFSAWTGRAVANWTPKLSWSDQSDFYLSYSRGYRSGGFNPPPAFPGEFPIQFNPETIDSFEAGAKNTFFNGTLLANLTAWYYNYRNFQVSTIVDRSSVNVNIDSKLWGFEGEFFYAPDENWQFNANIGYEHSRIGNSALVDSRDPVLEAPGRPAPNATLLKDAQGNNCVILAPAGAPLAAPGVFPFIVPGAAPLPSSVAAASGFLLGVTCATLPAALNGTGYSVGTNGGVAESLEGNQMPNSPPWTVDIGAQYTFHLGGGYSLVPRADFYWQDKMWGRIFEDGADRFKGWSVTNAQIQLNAPDSDWYARVWVQNLFDKDNETGEYLTDASAGLFTNVFVGTRRTYGLTVGAHF